MNPSQIFIFIFYIVMFFLTVLSYNKIKDLLNCFPGLRFILFLADTAFFIMLIVLFMLAGSL